MDSPPPETGQEVLAMRRYRHVGVSVLLFEGRNSEIILRNSFFLLEYRLLIIRNIIKIIEINNSFRQAMNLLQLQK